MKKYLLIFFLSLGSLSRAFAQDVGDDLSRHEKIQALYVLYVTQQLQLTPDEAQKFWPLHTQFENELKAVRKDQPELDKQQARLNIKKKYQDGFTKILGPNRCERFYGLGDEFRKKLLDRMEKRRNNQQKPQGRNNNGF